MLEIVLGYFKEDPLRILYLLGGSGGVFYWYDRWCSRARLRVRVISEYFDPMGADVIVTIKVECSNLGDVVTSLEPVVAAKAVCPNKSVKTFNLKICEDPGRSLSPHQPKEFFFKGTCEAVFPFTWYRRYRFALSRGRASNKYFLNASNKEICWLRYQLGGFLLRLFGWVPPSTN